MQLINRDQINLSMHLNKYPLAEVQYVPRFNKIPIQGTP